MNEKHVYSNTKEEFSKWENMNCPTAPLSDNDKELLIDLAGSSKLLPMSEKLMDQSKTSKLRKDKKNALALHGDALPKEKVNSNKKFLNWYESVEQEMEKEQDCQIHEYIDQLKSHSNECSSLIVQLDNALKFLEYVSDKYKSVSLRTSSLHTDCEQLLSDQTKLSHIAECIESKLNSFSEINNISKKLCSPVFQVTNNDFIPLLAKIDDCINYMTLNSNYLESQMYLAKYKQYLARALGMIKTYVVSSLVNSTQEVMSKTGKEKVISDNLLLLYYGKFRNNSNRIKTVMAEIEDRAVENSEYANLLSDCHLTYFQQRKIIMSSPISEALVDLQSKYNKDYCSFIRSSLAFFIHVCEDEYNLFHQFFSSSTEELDTFLGDICSNLYDVVRPIIIHIDHLETLSELCLILKRSLNEEQSSINEQSALTKAVEVLLEDCQERLVYRAFIYIANDIANFNPSPGDLAYPAKLEMMESITESLANEKNFIKDNHTEHFSSFGNSAADLHGMWYPTVRRTLVCLSKVYRCVDKSIFQGVCLEALSACIQSLSSASQSITKTATNLDAYMFEIKHILILREQLSPFQIDTSLRSHTIDWSNLREATACLMQNKRRLFSLNSNNSLLEFIVEGTPQVKEHVLDSKRDIDNKLKEVCESFIFFSTKLVVGSITPLKDHLNSSNVSVDKISEAVALAVKSLKTEIPRIQRCLQLYLSNNETEFIIMKPVRNNIISSFTSLKNTISSKYDQDDQSIIGCPSPEEISAYITLCMEKKKSESGVNK